jgi:hypothetical protein
MNSNFDTKAGNSPATAGISASAIIVRSILALLLCLLAWLCGRTSVMAERMGQVFSQLFTGSLPDDLSGFVWHHPRLLMAFAVVVAAAGLGFLAFSKVHRRAVLAAALAGAVLLGQWLIVTPSVYDTTMRTMHGVAEKVAQ